MRKPLSEFKVISFDCYGTLIDWESGIWDAFQPLLMANPTVTMNRGDALDDFARFENEVEAGNPSLGYRDVLSRVHARFAESNGLESSPELDGAFGNSVQFWPAFPDTADALRELKKRYRLVILSNIDHRSFAASNLKLGVEFDAIYTAEEIGTYKPNPANFHYMLEHLNRDFGIEQDEILHTAQSLFHDHAPAAHLGLANAWIDRQRLSEDGDWGATRAVARRPSVDYQFFTLAELAAAVR